MCLYLHQVFCTIDVNGGRHNRHSLELFNDVFKAGDTSAIVDRSDHGGG